MRVQNTGDSPFEFTAALHSYLEVTDVGQARVKGLQGLEYLDKVRRLERRFDASPFDRKE
jgi:glucose-6-phosphate 1-epimerase